MYIEFRSDTKTLLGRPTVFVISAAAFAAKSEHITLETVGTLQVTWANWDRNDERVFTGI